MLRFISLFLLFISYISIKAQSTNYPLIHELQFTQVYDPLIKPKHKTDSVIEDLYHVTNSNKHRLVYSHESFKPALCRNLVYAPYLPEHSKLRKSLFHQNLITVNDSSDNFQLFIDPLLNLEVGKDVSDTSNSRLYVNTRGINISGHIGETFSFGSSFHENQAIFPNYLQSFSETYDVVPGQGRWKRFKSNGYDYAMSNGYVSITPKHKNSFRFVNFQLGHGKHFIGNGYRSLLLSDNAFNYPYFKLTTRIKNLQYGIIYNILTNLDDGGVTTPPNTERLFQKKAGSFQYLSYIIKKNTQIGLFQGMIWEAGDSNNTQHLNLAYVNPVIGINPLLYGLNTTNNIVLGLNFKTTLLKNLSLYGQCLIDDFSKEKESINNKTGYQLGLTYTLFNKYQPIISANIEYNQVRPYTYAHKKVDQGYTHYNQALAHPLGANFKELVGIIRARPPVDSKLNRLRFNYKWNWAEVGLDSVGSNFGSNPFLSNNTAYFGINSTNNEFLHGTKTTIINHDISLGWVINQYNNLRLSMGARIRSFANTSTQLNTNYYYFSLNALLGNRYYDF